MWQTKYASAVPKNLGLGLNFWPCREGYFVSGCPQSVHISHITSGEANANATRKKHTTFSKDFMLHHLQDKIPPFWLHSDIYVIHLFQKMAPENGYPFHRVWDQRFFELYFWGDFPFYFFHLIFYVIFPYSFSENGSRHCFRWRPIPPCPGQEIGETSFERTASTSSLVRFMSSSFSLRSN